MELDFDLECDRIGQFLKNKLQEIQNKNNELEESLKYRQNISKTKCSKSAHSLQLGEVWKRIFQGNYVLGFAIESTIDRISGLNLILSWNKPINLPYKYQIISTRDDLKINNSPGMKYIVIVINIPSFIEQLEYNVQGFIEFQQEKINLPIIKLSNLDLTNNTILIQIYKVIDGNLEDFLTILSNNRKSEFVLILQKDYNKTIEIIFETYCALRCINLNMENQFYITHNISAIFNGCLVEINGNYRQKNHVHISLYCWSNNSLEALLHYLHRQIVNSSIIPYDIYNNSSNLYEDNLNDKLRNSLNNELTLLTNSKTVNADLSKIEFSTDLLAIKLMKN